MTRQRIATAADVISRLLPVVAGGTPAAAGVAAALEAVRKHVDNDIQPPSAVPSSSGLRQRIRALKRQLHDTPNTAESEKLRMKLDVLYDLLVEEAENPYE